MARELKGKLSAEDLVYLHSRYPDSYVDRMVELYGTKGASESKLEAAQTKAEQDAQEAAEAAAKEAEEAAAAAEQAKLAAEGGSGEDLIGLYDPTKHTEPEIKEHLAGVDDVEKARILSVESARADREPRKGVLAL